MLKLKLKYMEYYMNDVFQLTMESMSSGSDEIALQVWRLLSEI